MEEFLQRSFLLQRERCECAVWIRSDIVRALDRQSERGCSKEAGPSSDRLRLFSLPQVLFSSHGWREHIWTFVSGPVPLLSNGLPLLLLSPGRFIPRHSTRSHWPHTCLFAHVWTLKQMSKHCSSTTTGTLLEYPCSVHTNANTHPWCKIFNISRKATANLHFRKISFLYLQKKSVRTKQTKCSCCAIPKICVKYAG